MGIYVVGNPVNRPQGLRQGHTLWGPFCPIRKIPNLLSITVLMGYLAYKLRLVIHWIPGTMSSRMGPCFTHVCILSLVPGSQ